MVASRKCKVCTVSGTNHIPITETFFGKVLHEVVEKICDYELEPKKIASLLICQQCTRLLMQTEFVLERVRESFKNVGKTTKTPRVRSTTKKQLLNSSQTAVVAVEQITSDITPNKNPILLNLDETLFASKQNSAKRKLELKTNDLDSSELVHSNEENEILEKGGIVKKSKKNTLAADNPVTTPNTEGIVTSLQQSSSKSKKRKSTSEMMDNNDDKMKSNKTDDDRSLNVSQEQSFLLNGSTMDVNSFGKTPSKQIFTMTQDDDEPVIYNSQDDSLVKVKTVNCILCKMEFHSKTDLYAHIDAQHFGEKLKQCIDCDMEFTSMQKYESHIRNEKCKNRKFMCQHMSCGRRFSTKQKLETHNQSKHNNSNEEKY